MNRFYDVVIVGGGFYGCALALYLSSPSTKVALLESSDELMTRASSINQARIHNGFHYPRSFGTALRSFHNYSRFKKDFEFAIEGNFQMYYAIAKKYSKVKPKRFFSMFQDMGAPIRRANKKAKMLFNPHMIDDVFECDEICFNYKGLKEIMVDRLQKTNVDIFFNTKCVYYEKKKNYTIIHSENNLSFQAPLIFNITYANINLGLHKSDLQMIDVKHEMAEIALIEPPSDLKNCAVTIMDGPFFSALPYPAENLYSLSHVRYTPHYSWTDKATHNIANFTKDRPQKKHWRHMVCDAIRYMPCFEDVIYKKSLFEIKTIPIKNEENDGRPILLVQHEDMPGLISVLGSKIDNIYDLFDSVNLLNPQFKKKSMLWWKSK